MSPFVRLHPLSCCDSAIVSSPLVLSHDLTNTSVMDWVWPVVSNREALAVKRKLFGDAASTTLNTMGNLANLLQEAGR